MMAGFLGETWRDLIAVTGLALAVWQAWASIRQLIHRASGVVRLRLVRRAAPIQHYGEQFSPHDRKLYSRFVAAVAMSIVFVSFLLPSLPEWAAGILLMLSGIGAFAETFVIDMATAATNRE